MRVAIISDIHGNLEALEAVAGELDRLGIKDVVCLGDVVGYGASPRECIDFVSDRAMACVAGNHDVAAIFEGAADAFNQAARLACDWTSKRLRASDRGFLGALPMRVSLDELKVQLVHADGVLPGMFDYIQDCADAQRALSAVEPGGVCFVGHTHVAMCFQDDTPSYVAGKKFVLRPHVRTLINVGSVGQPRDGDRRACFAVLDSEERSVELRRVAYDFEGAALKIRNEGLPQILSDRLRYGR